MSDILLKECKENISKFLEEIVKKTNGKKPTKDLITDIWKKAGEYDIFRTSPENKLAGFHNRSCSIYLFEELGKHLLLDFPFWLQSDVVSYLINRYGTDHQKEFLLNSMTSGEKIGALALTEIQGGSDFNQFQCNVSKVGKNYVLNGEKCFVTNGTIADFYLVAAKYSDMGENYLSFFLVDSHQVGVRMTTLNNEISMKWLDMGELTFDNVLLTEEQILGGKAIDVRLGLVNALTIERFACSVISFHMCEVLLSDALAWSKERKIEGSNLANMQYIRYQLGNYYASIRVIKQYIEEIKERYIKNQKLSVTDVAIAKFKTLNLLVSLSEFVIKLYGARAFVNKIDRNDILKIHNDALAQSVAGGTSEVMLKIISESLFRQNF